MVRITLAGLASLALVFQVTSALPLAGEKGLSYVKRESTASGPTNAGSQLAKGIGNVVATGLSVGKARAESSDDDSSSSDTSESGHKGGLLKGISGLVKGASTLAKTAKTIKGITGGGSSGSDKTSTGSSSSSRRDAFSLDNSDPGADLVFKREGGSSIASGVGSIVSGALGIGQNEGAAGGRGIADGVTQIVGGSKDIGDEVNQNGGVAALPKPPHLPSFPKLPGFGGGSRTGLTSSGNDAGSESSTGSTSSGNDAGSGSSRLGALPGLRGGDKRAVEVAA